MKRAQKSEGEKREKCKLKKVKKKSRQKLLTDIRKCVVGCKKNVLLFELSFENFLITNL